MKKKISDLTDKGLQNLIENHRARDATNRPEYVEALEELARRKGKGLEFDTSIRLIQAAAAEGRFLSYKDLADASNAKWTRVHYSIGEHLWSLLEFTGRKGIPMVSSVVVNKPNVATGEMEPDTLKGFIAAARALGHEVTDEKEFLREQQRRVFEWAQATPAGTEAAAS